MIEPRALLERWEQELEVLRRCGATEAASTRERDIEDLRAWWTERQYDLLTLGEAAHYSGLAQGTVANKIRSGEIPNAGDKHRPRVRRCDLPARAPGPPGRPDLDLADTILSRSGS